jgi:hypothetical protein
MRGYREFFGTKKEQTAPLPLNLSSHLLTHPLRVDALFLALPALDSTVQDVVRKPLFSLDIFD